MNDKRIAYVTGEYPKLSETFIEREICELRRKGFDVVVFAIREKENYEEAVYRAGLILRPLRLVRLFCAVMKLFMSDWSDGVSVCRKLYTICNFAEEMKKRKVGHIHACFLSLPASMSYVISAVTGIGYSVSGHARDVYVENGGIEAKIKGAKFVTVCSESVRRYLHKFADRVVTVYHGLPRELLKGDTYRKRGATKRMLIVGVGRLVEKKGFDVLLEAMAIFVRERRDGMLLIVGEGSEEKRLREICGRLGIGGWVQFCGSQEREAVLRIIAEATVLAVPSVVGRDGDRDGIANVILEAFAVRTAVVASSLESIREVVIDGETGLLFEAGNAAELAERLLRIADDEVLREKLVVNGESFVRKNFDGERNIEKLVTLFDECLRGAGE